MKNGGEKFVYYFDIANNQNEYARCTEFIEDIYHKKLEDFQKYKLKVLYRKVDEKQPLCKEFLEAKGFGEWRGEDISQISNGESLFIFHAMCSNEDDIVNLIYFCLMKEKHPRSILCVDSEDLGKAGATIPYFLYDEVKKYSSENHNRSGRNVPLRDKDGVDYNSFDYFINTANKGIIPMLLPEQKRIVRKFSSLIEIDQAQNTARVWGESVGNCLAKLYKKCEWQWKKNTDTEFIFRNYWPNILPKALQIPKAAEAPPALKNLLEKKKRKDILERQGKLAEQHWEYRLFVLFTECLCTMLDRNSVKLTYSRYHLLQTDKFFEMVKDMPLLAFYIFCLFDVASKNEDELKKDEEKVMEQLREQIFNARDMAEGLLQIIENVYHSQYHKGYFCFRIHTLQSGKNDYLDQNYYDYLQKGIAVAEIGSRHVLEVKVVDYSHQTIPEMFYRNFEKRMQKAGDEDKFKYKEIADDAKKITLQSFFSPDGGESRFWQKYNDIAENVVHHYGLQAFDSFVANNRGYFYVQSCKEYLLKLEEDCYNSLGKSDEGQTSVLPGSQYEVLIPFQVELEPQNTLLNVNIGYTNNLCIDYQLKKSISFTSKECIAVFDSQPPELAYQERKEGMIHELYRNFAEAVSGEMGKNEEKIIWCPASDISLSMIEIFCKVVMLYIVKQGIERNVYFMITSCTNSHFIEITRMFALFYNKQGMAYAMKNVQIYLSGPDNEEFLLAGDGLGAITTKAEKLAFARGVTPKCVRMLNLMLKNRTAETVEDIDVVPFDMIQYDESQETLFEQNVRNILTTDIQSEKFGCKLENLHVRIGNKIHVTTFYEAELLFHNNYYISRFAYWLVKEISKGELDTSAEITLVGYETYSEMLLQEVRDWLPKLCDIDIAQINCIIYEQKTLEKFRAPQALYKYADSQFLLIVPINSTTTTHSKLAGFLQQEIDRSWEQATGEKIESEIRITGNYGIILIGSDAEVPEGLEVREEYWEPIERNRLWSKVLEDKVTFFLEVDGIWHDPLTCEKCFPKEKPDIWEQPLIETNKESIVPMHDIRMKRRYAEQEMVPVWNQRDKKELKMIEKLSQYLIYSHITRKGNHFQYYFQTEKYMADPTVENDVCAWLEGCQKEYKRSLGKESVVFDVIVSPLHFSNAAFTNAVNKYFFNDAALVLHFDIEKEFRSNVKTKYSNLLSLYDNLHAYGVNAAINFHYTDDTLVSGATYTRARDLMNSIFPREDGKVKVNIFASVIVLLNRMSPDSKRGYVRDITSFYSYVDLRISSMRNHEDACILCKKEKEYLKLAEQASLNEVYSYWEEKSGHYKCRNLEEYYIQYQKRLKKEPEKTEEKRRRAALRMIYSHKANLLFSRVENDMEEVIEKTIYSNLLMKNSKPVDVEEMIACLKVIAKPFISFNKEVKSVIFSIMLRMLDYLLMKEEERGQAGQEYNDIKDCLVRIKDNEAHKVVKILINRLVELGSNYVIRKRNMLRLLDYGAEQQDKKKFYFSYVNRVKQLIFNSTDEIKCLYLEYLLLYEEEYVKGSVPLKFRTPLEDGEKEDCLRAIFLENTRAIINGIQYLCLEKKDSEENIVKALNKNYYLENYARFLQFQQVLEKDGEEYRFKEGEFEKIQGLTRLKKLLDSGSSQEKEDEDSEKELPDKLYGKLLENMIAAAGADRGEFVVPYRSDREELYMPLGFDAYQAFQDGAPGELIEKYHEQLQNNTFQIIPEERDTAPDGRYVLIRYSGSETEEHISELYLVLHFGETEITKLYMAIRNALVFGRELWRAFNFTSNALLRNWMNDRYFKEQMSKTRAISHQDEKDLRNNLKHVLKMYKFQKNLPSALDTDGKIEENIKRSLSCFLTMAVNNLIGYYNVKLLSGDFHDCMPQLDYGLQEFWQSICPEIEMAADLWELRLAGEDGQKDVLSGLSGKMAMCRGHGESLYLLPEVWKMMVLSALKSISVHCGGNTEANIYREGKFLYIENVLKGQNPAEVKRKLELAKRRAGEGISIPVIIDICRDWYGEEDVAYVDEEREPKHFVVRLPIVETEENTCT